MAERIKFIDIGETPELLKLAEEVHRTHEPRLLRREGEDLAMVVPLPDSLPERSKKPSAAEYDAFRRAAGSWSDIDTEALKEYIYRAREEGTRPSDRPPAYHRCNHAAFCAPPRRPSAAGESHPGPRPLDRSNGHRAQS